MKGLLTASLALVAAGVMAQENGNRDEQNRVVRGPYETNRFFDNIFIGVAGGVNIYHGENDSYGKFGKRLAPALDVNVGVLAIRASTLKAGRRAKRFMPRMCLIKKPIFTTKNSASHTCIRIFYGISPTL